MPSKTTKVRGCLGSGKTEFLAKKTIELIQQDTAGRVAYVGYTKSANKSILDRLHKKLGLTCCTKKNAVRCKEFPYIGTFHSICAGLIGIKKQNIITPTKFKEFESISPLPFESNLELDQSDLEKLPQNAFNLSEKPKGNAALIIIGNCRTRKLPLTQWEQTVTTEDRMELRFTPELLTSFKNVYDEWKTKNNLYDYQDILEETLRDKRTPLLLKHLIVDEFQDLYPLIYDVFKLWKENADGEVYFGGDEHQTIYRFSGADENTFLKEPYDDIEQLDTNHRCPERIWELCKNIIRPVQLYDIDQIKPKFAEGEIVHHHSANWNLLKPFDGQTTLYLTHTNREANALTEILLEEGIVHSFTTKEGSITRKFIDIYNTLIKLKQPETATLTYGEVRASISVTPSKEFLVRGVKTKFKEEINVKTSEYTLQDFCELFKPGKEPSTPLGFSRWKENLSFTKLQTKFLESPKRSKNVTIGTIQTFIGTNHSGKGLTADRVVLFNHMPKPVERTWPLFERDERYLIHMAIGRASKRVDLVHLAPCLPFIPQK